MYVCIFEKNCLNRDVAQRYYARCMYSATSRVILLLLALSIVHLYFEIDLKDESIERKTYYLSPKVY